MATPQEILRTRLLWFFVVIAGAFLVLTFQQTRLALGFGRPPVEDVPRRPERGAIYDRRGVPLAISLERYHLYLNTRKAIAPKHREAIKAVLGMDEETLARCQATPKTYLVVKHALLETAEAARKVKSDALLVEKVWQRSYPQGTLLAHTLGYTGFEGHGFAGLERQYQELLSGGGGQSNFGDLILSIDAEVQYAAENFLAKGIAEHDAQGGILLAQDVATGRLLTLAVNPGFDPSRPGDEKPGHERNPAVSIPVEPGSVFKIFYLAHLLEKYQVDVDKPYYYCGEKTVLENGEVIVDYKAWGWVSFRDIVKHSVNGGIIQAAQPLSQQDRYDLVVRMRMNQATGIDLPAESRGMLQPTRNWGIRTTATILIGQGVAVTPVQLISAFSALVGGGVWHAPRIVDRIVFRGAQGLYTQGQPTPTDVRIFEAEAARRTLSLLAAGTVPGSTGELARSTGYDSVGKTGTSQMVNLQKGGYYSNQFNALFVGAFPEKAPRVSMLVILFNPKAGHTGGVAAAPIYAKLLPDLVRHLDLPVTRELSTLPSRVLEAARTPEVPVTREVPDFSGLSERDARARFATWLARNPQARGAQLSVVGEGYVKSQTPPAGTVIASPSAILQVTLGAP